MTIIKIRPARRLAKVEIRSLSIGITTPTTRSKPTSSEKEARRSWPRARRRSSFSRSRAAYATVGKAHRPYAISAPGRIALGLFDEACVARGPCAPLPADFSAPLEVDLVHGLPFSFQT